MNYTIKIAKALNLTEKQVKATVALLEEGGTVPFIARYRKELTGSLDEVAISAIRDQLTQLKELDKRRATILKTIQEQEKLTPELEAKINAVETLSALEDLYLPYKPKRRTKATVAREKGLDPLALLLLTQEEIAVEEKAANFINPEKEVNTVEEALEGARHIIAEIINEDQEARASMRRLFEKKALVRSQVLASKKEEEAAQKFKDYFDWSEALSTVPSHRLLAMRRGEKEMILSLDIAPDDEEAVLLLEKHILKAQNEAAEQVKLAIKDCYKRLLKPSMETEMRLLSKKKADEEAIRVFTDNLRELLLAAPLGERPILALDPGFRTGCKLVVLSSLGKLLHHDTIYPNEPQKEIQKASALVQSLVEEYQVAAIAIGNGTASRETERFVQNLSLPNITILMVNESGASIYSASQVAREEFPDKDVTVRGAVSIGRRLQDPLAELVKIDPKSIGVGQYQHDVDQTALKKSLDDIVMSCVNAVGVEVNTASKQLLMYVAGLGESLAANIVQYREENGAFKSREALKQVPRLGAKAYEQCAGFLRIRGAENPLDSSAVHPETYTIVTQMAKDVDCTVKDLMEQAALRKKLNLQKYISEQIGLPTLNDIVAELAKPGRDPREKFEVFAFADDVHEITDLKVGMKLPGIVTNVTKFGAFIDIGVHQDGLVHISELSNQFISDPNTVVKVQQKVQVTVLDVNLAQKRISLSMKEGGQAPSKKKKKQKKTTTPENDMQAQLMALKKKFNT